MEYFKLNGQHFYNMVVYASNKLEEQKDHVNALNVFPVPDGDTGTNMSMTFRNAVADIKNTQHMGIGEMAKKLSRGALMGARGNSGVILSQIFRGIAKGLENKEEATSEEFANALMEGAKSAYKAVMRPTEGTILTIIAAAGETAVKSNEKDLAKLMVDVCREAEIVLNKTPDMNPVLKKANVVDSGGLGLLIILKGMKDVLLEDIKNIDIADVKQSSNVNAAQNLGEQHEIKFGYCTEFIILADNVNIDEFKKDIEQHGDSMVVVGMEEIVKVHIHTNDPGLILSKAVKLGELSKIKIDNMREEHRHVLEGDYSLAEGNSDNNTVSEKKKYAFVSVALGDGIKEIFKDLGVDCVIEGGQTMNPSTQDILAAISTINAENVFVLPNNKNIIMAAEQAAELSDKNVVIITTKNIPQGITAVTAFNGELEVEENINNMKEAIANVKSGQVTYAVRDTEMDGNQIKCGDILGIRESKINQVGNNIYEVCEKLIENMVDEESELITVFYGKDCEENEVNEFVTKLEEKFSDLDVQAYSGQQPLYYFILSVE